MSALVLLNPADDVATLVKPAKAGEKLVEGGAALSADVAPGHKIAAKALAAEVDEFAKVAEEQVGSSRGGATGGGGSGSVENSGGATGGSAASKVELASFLKEVSAREDSIATEAREADAMADENVNVAR